MLLTQKLGSTLQRSKSYCDVYVVSGIHWPPFCKRRGQPLQVCAHVCQSRAKRALVCLSPGYQSLSPKTSICSIFSQNSCLVPLIFFTRATHLPARRCTRFCLQSKVLLLSLLHIEKKNIAAIGVSSLYQQLLSLCDLYII